MNNDEIQRANFKRLSGFIATGREAVQSNDITNLFASSFNIMIGLRNFGLSTTYHDSFVYVERMNANKTKPQQAGKAYLELCQFVELAMQRIGKESG